jgi:hypothetical protein
MVGGTQGKSNFLSLSLTSLLLPSSPSSNEEYTYIFKLRFT